MSQSGAANNQKDHVPPTLTWPGAVRFWFVVMITGVATGVAAIVLTKLLEFVQRLVWGGDGREILAAASSATAIHCILALLGAGIVTGIGQIVLVKLTSGNGIDVTSAIWFTAGRMPLIRTLGSATLSEIIVGMGASLGREGGPKQAGAVAANFFADRARLSDEQRRLLVACGAGAGMAAAYGVPLGGALFSLEVLRGILALRLILPALLTSVIAASISWLALPNAPTYHVPAFSNSGFAIAFALAIGALSGIASVGYVRAIAWADQNKPTGGRRLIAPAIVLGGLGLFAVYFPQLLGNGRDLSERVFNNGILAPAMLFALLALKPLATTLCIRSGAPGGLFTPSLTLGALLGGFAGSMGNLIWPALSPGFGAFLGASGVLAATTQGPISAAVLMMELSDRDRTLIAPLLVSIVAATLVARTLEARSIYDARLSDEQVQTKLAGRNQLSMAPYERKARRKSSR